VEEAAEVLESHIVVNLTENCQHLILIGERNHIVFFLLQHIKCFIGDHQQLRPSTASYALGRKFNLEISLFERMFRNNINCYRLVVQHRMRPEISKLITPSIYDVLHDHESVKDFPDVKGVAKNLYFVDHSHPEENVRLLIALKQN
jgi:superfamily I DNA and/or RNA helicase